MSPGVGSQWMSEAPCSIALWMHELDDRRVVFGVVQDGLLRRLLVVEVLDRRVEPVLVGDQAADVLARRGRRANLVTGQHRQVVDRKYVAGIGHRDDQHSVFGPADRHRLVAPGSLDADQGGGAGVDVEQRQVDVVDAEALGQHPGELLLGEHTPLEQHLADQLALGASRRDRRLDSLAVGKAEVDHDVADQSSRPALLGGGNQARNRCAAGRRFGPTQGRVGGHRVRNRHKSSGA
jgi:hypothetical protein